ncbi:MAG: hypothetical protein WC538_08940 [Thermoanaerobaculia bacterium]
MSVVRLAPRIGAAVLLLLLTGATRCASWRQEVTPLPPLGAAGPAEAWDELLRIRRESPRLASYASIRVESDGSKQSFRATIATDERGCLRVDAFTPMGTAAFTLYADGDETTMIDHVNRSWWKGTFPTAARSLGLPGSLDAHSLAMIAFGLPASAEPESERGERIVQAGVVYRVDAKGLAEVTGEGWTAKFNTPSFPASSVTISTADGGRAMTVRHLEPGAASRDVDAPKIDASYRCCVEPAAR